MYLKPLMYICCINNQKHKHKLKIIEIMKTQIDNTQRKFFICETGWSSNSYVCNLHDIENVIKEIADCEPYKIYHIWNHQMKALSKKQLNEMFEANSINFRFKC